MLHPPVSSTIYTPEPLANAMVRALSHGPNDIWLEPCVGQGALTSALNRTGVSRDRIIAIDLDESRSSNDSFAQTLRGTEFLAWSLKPPLRFDKIIANPPYINLDQLAPEIKRAALRIKCVDGTFIGDGSNCWVAFLSACLTLLKPNGSLCFLLPAAWDYANYAATIRNILPNHFEFFEIHRSRDPLFDSVRDGCVVIVGRGFERPHCATTRIEYNSSVDLIKGLRSRPTRNIPRITSQTRSIKAKSSEKLCTLGEIMHIRLGGVTGEAKYFLLTEEKRLELGLPTSCLKPVLTRSRHLVSNKMTKKEWNNLRKKGERIWLFDPPPRTLKHRTVKSYLALSPKLGGCHKGRAKIQERNLWYRTVLPKRIDGFISGMSRLGPWISFREMPRLVATNTLYTISFREHLTNDQKAAWALSLIANHQRGTLSKSARIYPEGLYKYEPSDLLNLRVRKIPKRTRGARATYKKAIKLLLNGKIAECQKLAKGWLGAAR